MSHKGLRVRHGDRGRALPMLQVWARWSAAAIVPAESRCFQLLGLDLLLDVEGKLWLLEINKNPDLEIHCQTLEEVIPAVVEDTLGVVLQHYWLAKSGTPADNLSVYSGRYEQLV